MNIIYVWIFENWQVTLPIILSLIAILFTGLKDFIIPAFIKPRLKFSYNSKEPYKRGPIILNTHSFSVFDRFKVENVGRDIAKNCRCQIYSIENAEGKKFDLHGFPIRWASRPEPVVDFIKAERLNIAPGESEFVDLAYMRTDNTTKIFFNSYHNIPIGMDNSVPFDEYIIEFIVSGDNFRPYLLKFRIHKKIDLNGFYIKLLEVK